MLTDQMFELAIDIICNTSQSVFLTGKAGTGKTTLLHHISGNCSKNIIVAAPTGIAAINAGGVTLHSLLQLPFEAFIPDYEGKKKLDFHFKLRKSKIRMLQELDLLIIDEVSMLRADVLDAVDYMLRRYRNSLKPFGGVQMLFIGDMFQLPPVVQSSEWELLNKYYESPFFFQAQVLKNFPLLHIELKTVYRQSDQLFIDILNRIRNNKVTDTDLSLLNGHYNPAFKTDEKNDYIILCTHNYQADRINERELASLPKKETVFKGTIHGDFSENSLPTELNLTLKEGAQIMFIKNDSGEKRRYYNGKLAIITNLEKDYIVVRFRDGNELKIEPETWKNVSYKLNEESGDIEEKELGSFSQYPIRLAWAITIHKSQGLTFEKVIIDAGQAFAPGQVYVALSRCVSLDGIVLYSRLTPQVISTNRFISNFSLIEHDIDYLKNILNAEKSGYCAKQLKKYFDWSPYIRTIHTLKQLIDEKKIPGQEIMQETVILMLNKAIEQQEIARNFEKQLDKILSIPEPDISKLTDRVQKAALYFHNDINVYILSPLNKHIESLKKMSKVKAYLKKIKEIQATLVKLLEKLENINYGGIPLTKDLVFPKHAEEESSNEEKKKNPVQKGDSKRLSLSLLQEGKTIQEIANERNLAISTVESHLAGFILTGEISISELIKDEKLKYMLPVIENNRNKLLSEIKHILPDECTYSEIRAILNHIKYINNKK